MSKARLYTQIESDSDQFLSLLLYLSVDSGYANLWLARLAVAQAGTEEYTVKGGATPAPEWSQVTVEPCSQANFAKADSVPLNYASGTYLQVSRSLAGWWHENMKALIKDTHC